MPQKKDTFLEAQFNPVKNDKGIENRVACKMCGDEKYRNSIRMRNHILNCDLVSAEVKDKCRQHLKKRPRVDESSDNDTEDEADFDGETAAATEIIAVSNDDGISFVELAKIPESQTSNVHGASNGSVVHQPSPVLDKEMIQLQKIDLYMKMRKYQNQGILGSSDVKLITRWIKNPLCSPFKKSTSITETTHKKSKKNKQ